MYSIISGQNYVGQKCASGKDGAAPQETQVLFGKTVTWDKFLGFTFSLTTIHHSPWYLKLIYLIITNCLNVFLFVLNDKVRKTKSVQLKIMSSSLAMIGF